MTITPDDVISNAFIEMLETDPSNRFISYDSLDAYQKAVTKYLTKAGGLIYNQYWSKSINQFLYENPDFFLESEDKKGIVLSKDITLHCLKETFRMFLPLKMLKAFKDKRAVNILIKKNKR